ncbi:MAG: glucosaminidase domain-containing protein [Bacteroidetes bacterium]|nr:glucosaminidase domain-containing protein [Bacteroidota bacterium]
MSPFGRGHLRALFLALCLGIVTNIKVQAGSLDSVQQVYIKQYQGLAMEHMRLHRIPVSITLAQGLLESAAGTSPLALKGNNHFGIKCGMGWKGDSMHVDDDRPMDCFRVYAHPDSSFEDRVRFLGKARYRFLFDSLAVTDYRGWALGLKKAGYATDTAYPSRLIGLIERLTLHRLDTLALAVPKATEEEVVLERKDELVSVRKEEVVPVSVSPLYNVEAEKQGWIVVTRPGDSPLSVAERTGLPLVKLQAYNNLRRDENSFEPCRVLIINRYRYERELKSQKALSPRAPAKGE